MRINFNPNSGQILNVARINQSVQRKSGQETVNSAETRQDKMALSPGGKKAQGVLNGLMQRKQEILDQKNKLVEKTLANGGSLGDIKEQLKAYEEQLKNIEDQVTKSLAEEAEKQVKEKEEKAASVQDKPKTKEEVESAKIKGLTGMAVNLEQASVLQEAKAGIQGEMKVLEAEIKIDGPGADSSRKQDKLSELKLRVEDIDQKASEKLGETNDIQEEITESADEDSDKLSQLTPKKEPDQV